VAFGAGLNLLPELVKKFVRVLTRGKGRRREERRRLMVGEEDLPRGMGYCSLVIGFGWGRKRMTV
jgi:hypothetical protein